ncbi:type I restriction-modification system endonuclease [Phaeobacter inhibens]|uniref:type I restriction-modification system endonuclease n=1 Tax=Phaeobacter inhibens TaxID=221822 RepID=UPI0026E3A440|nr:type I restriction-modification system endonuclease [Phaeobacter inhibens]MDO6757043.1 type I restriction-modification system endonuclease [Phaeobacter inhibens]
MQSLNFEFLFTHDPKLRQLGGSAEANFADDPNTTLIKVRQFGELLASHVAAKAKMVSAVRGTQVELLNALHRQGVLDKKVADAFHLIRKKGNAATHEFTGSREDALRTLQFAFRLGVWFHQRWGDRSFNPPQFVPPKARGEIEADIQSELADLQQKYMDALSDAERATEKAEAEAQRRLSAEEQVAQAKEEREVWEALAAEHEETNTELLSRLNAAQEAAQDAPIPADVPLVLNETETRALIDSQLRDAGWEADTQRLRHSKGARPDQARAIAIAEWPTTSGPVDYALFLDGLCVGLIEAKHDRTDVPGVLSQTMRYGRDVRLDPEAVVDGVPYDHADDSYRVPFLFATNGRGFVKQYKEKSGIWFWDARAETNRSLPLPEWFSPDDVRAKLEQETQSSIEDLRNEPLTYGGLRPYQKEAITAIEEAIGDGQRDILVAMATGTGKTRTCIALMYRLLKHKRFRRILFLVDRRTLAEQTFQALENTELEGLLKFSETYNVAGLGKRMPEREDRVQIATVQSLVKRMMYASDDDEKLTPGLYDCIIVDEAHRGYTLDAELREEDIEFRNTEDYLSKYRKVLDFFDATKVALTATPALHTSEIFGHPVYRYSYRQAVIDGHLIDHLPPKRIVTALNEAGIHFEGGETVELIDMKTGEVEQAELPDEIDFEVEQFNKRVHTRAFNRVVCETIAEEVPPDSPGKVLIFASRDDHADLLVEELQRALEQEHGPQPKGLVEKITGKADRPSDVIRRFRNDDRPKYVVTVDLLTTGVDIPKITDLVFVRRVNSRILYDQMIGRATRKADEIGKEFFRIFDAVDLYANLQAMTDMRPVVANPNITFTQLAQDLQNATDPLDKSFVCDQIIVRTRLKARRISPENAEHFERVAGQDIEAFLDWLQLSDPADIETFLTDTPRVLEILDRKDRSQGGGSKQVISNHEDELLRIEDVFGDNLTPEDYIESFERYIRENMNQLPGLIAATQRPRELTRKALKDIADTLDEKGFSETALRSAYGRTRNADIAAHIIGFIRQAAIGDPLVPYTTRVDNAVAKIETSRNWTKTQRQWLRRLGRALKEQPIGDPALLNEGAFAQNGGFDVINQAFDNHLETVLQDLNDAIWASA